MIKRLKFCLSVPLPTACLLAGSALAQVADPGIAPASVAIDQPQIQWEIAPRGTVAPTGMVLSADTTLSAETRLPGGTVLPAGTLLPAGTVLPEGTVLPLATPTLAPESASETAPPAPAPVLPVMDAPGATAASNPPIPPSDPPPVADLSALTPGVPYLSGGIGASEREEMAQAKSSYNLRLLFAVQGSGAYLANVKVRIADATGATVLTAISRGPWLYANLTPGRYLLTLDKGGQIQTREVLVPTAGATQQAFYWAP